MATYSYTPSAGEVGGAPSGFAFAGGGGTTASYSVVDAGSGRYAVRFTSGDFASTAALVWSSNGNPPAFADGEAYMRFRHRSDTAAELGMFLRAAGANPNWTSGSFTAYWNRVRINGTSGLCRYREYDGGSPATEIDWATLTSIVGVDIHLMLKVSGTSIQYKAWKEGDSEPAYTTTTDSTNNTASLLRLFFTNTMDTDLFFIGVGTGTDAAPRGGAPIGGPTINTQPSNQAANEPGTATFSVSATTSGGALTYQWQRAAPGSGTFSNVSTGTGGTSASYTTAATSAAADHSAQYRCIVTDSNGPTTSSAATLTVRSTTTTARPSADVSAGGWTPSTGAVLWDMIDEAVASDTDYITSPSITTTPAPAVMALPYPVNTGTWNIGIRARSTGASGTMRVKLLDGSGTVVGTSADQAITSTFTNYTLPITTSAPALWASVEVVS